MTRIIEIDVGELWHNTFDTTTQFKRMLGTMHWDTTHVLLENPNAHPTELPLYTFMMSPSYPRERSKQVCIAYLDKYKRIFNDIKNRGYKQQQSLIPVRITPDGKVCLEDGRRRLTSILVIGKQKRIKVEVVCTGASG